MTKGDIINILRTAEAILQVMTTKKDKVVMITGSNILPSRYTMKYNNDKNSISVSLSKSNTSISNLIISNRSLYNISGIAGVLGLLSLEKGIRVKNDSVTITPTEKDITNLKEFISNNTEAGDYHDYDYNEFEER